MLGGGVCPKCKRPFALHIYGLNLIAGKFDRCPFCGRWSLVRRLPLEALRRVEAVELQAEQGAARLPDDSEEEYRKQIEDMRYLTPCHTQPAKLLSMFVPAGETASVNQNHQTQLGGFQNHFSKSGDGRYGDDH